MRVCEYTLRVQKYGNEGPENSFLRVAYKAVRKVGTCFTMEIIADMTKTNSYVNGRFHFGNMPNFSNYSFVI